MDGRLYKHGQACIWLDLAVIMLMSDTIEHEAIFQRLPAAKT